MYVNTLRVDVFIPKHGDNIYTLVLLDIDINDGRFNQRELSYKESSLLHGGSFIVRGPYAS
tara:strand:+ start:1920 stop:2102 length:183 start_codon:yes stop_codon:yes gene_type:complete